MKRLFNKISFGFRYASKNIVFSKLKAIALLITFSIVFVVIFLILSVRPLVSSYYYHQVEEKYSKFDLIMSVDENTNARFFSRRHLNNEGIKDYAYFFEINTLLLASRQEYIKVVAGSLEDLKKVSKYVESNYIGANEIIITNSLAQAFELEIGAEVSLQLDNSIKYRVLEVVEDGGLFSQNTVFMNKDENISYILSALNLGKIDPDLTKNLFNMVYLEVTDINIIDELKSINEYQHLSIEPTYSEASIEQNIDMAISGFYVVFALVLIAILLVLHSSLVIMFRGRVQEIGIIKSLGGKSVFFLGIIIIEFFIYLILSLIFGVFLTNLLVNLGLDFIIPTLTYRLSFKSIFLGLIIVSIIVYLAIYLNYSRIKKTSIIALSQDNKTRVKTKISLYLVVLIFLLFINLIFNKNDFLQALFTIVLVIMLGFTCLRIFLRLGKVYKKKSLFSIISLKNINQNKTISHNLNIILVSFFAIILIVSSINYHRRGEEKIKETLSADFLITNIVADPLDTVKEIQDMENILSVDEAYLFQNIEVFEEELVIDYLVSVTSSKIFAYLELSVNEAAIKKLNDSNTPAIILSEKYRILYNYQVDDLITLKISEEFPNEDFLIAGFFSERNTLIAVSNMIDCLEYGGLIENALLINASGDKDYIYQELINKYQSKLYYIIDFELIVTDVVAELKKVMDYLSYVSYIIIVCFVFTIFNNSILIFEEMKSTYAKMKVLGATNWQLISMSLKENLYLLIAILISVILMAVGVIPNLKFIVARFSVYYPLGLNFIDFYQSILACVLMYIVSYCYYFLRLRRINIIEEIKLK